MTPDIQKTLDKLRAKTVFQIGFEGAPDPVRQEQEPSALNLEAAALIERLAGALEEIVERWDTPNWKDTEPTAHVIARARRALSGEPTPIPKEQ